MRIKTRLALVLVSLTVTGSVSFAAERAGAFFVRPQIGFYMPATKRHLDNHNIVGMVAGYDVTDRWAMAVGANVVNTTQKDSVGGAHVHGFLYTMDAIYRLNDYRDFSPYLFVGPQVINLKPATGADPNTQMGASFGVGAGYFLARSAGLTFEARDLYTFSGGKNDLLFTMGVLFLLGG